MRRPERVDGFAPIRDYAVIGDRRTAALVALDGSIDWLCLPRVDGAPVLAALLDPSAGGRFALAPAESFAASRRYRPGSNVLDTTFETAGGTVRVTDAMAWPRPAAGAELVRRVEGLAGEVALRWTAAPRAGWAQTEPEVAPAAGQTLLACGDAVLGISAWDAGPVETDASGAGGAFTCRAGDRALLALRAGTAGAPPAAVERDAAEARLEATAAAWEAWAARAIYEGPWEDAVRRSALALALLVDEPSGAIVAAATTSLPEALGGPRNYDYRLAWLRDANLSVDALLRVGHGGEATAALEWLLATSERSQPRLRPIYTLDGEPAPGAVEVALRGYRDSGPVRHGNDAAGQLQLGVHGDLLEIAWMHVQVGRAVDPATGARLAAAADALAASWGRPDAGLWELHESARWTQSKLACVVALGCAMRMAEAGAIPAGNAPRWAAERERARAFVQERCWSDARGAYVRCPGSDGLDAGVLLTARVGVPDAGDERTASTIAALRTELGSGPLLHRFSGAQEREGAFLPCSFWLAEALAAAGRADEAAELLDQLTGLASDVGLYAEEVDPADGAFLGNLPQALSHIGLIAAACTVTARGLPA
jgi:GH15 family glucan-1,4-alpha-glucosidase